MKPLGTGGERVSVEALWDTAKVEITLRSARHAGKRRSASPSRRTRRRRRNEDRSRKTKKRGAWSLEHRKDWFLILRPGRFPGLISGAITHLIHAEGQPTRLPLHLFSVEAAHGLAFGITERAELDRSSITK